MVPLVILASLGLLCPALGHTYNDFLSDISNLYGMDDRGFFDEQIASRSSPDDVWSLSYRDPTMNDPELFSEAALRDQEFLEHSPLWGYQSVSGGTGEGKESTPKSDKVLPAYCNPPNPCPMGYTSEDNCLEHFENTPDNNRRLMKQQDCPCDREHMLSCPKDKDGVSTKPEGTQAIDSMLSDIAMEDIEPNQYGLMNNEKRLKLVAKKSPHMIRKRDLERLLRKNPFLKGEHLKLAAKKADSQRGLRHQQFKIEY